MENQEQEKFHTEDVLVAQNYLFSKFMLSEKMLKAMTEMNYLRPSPIQVKIIPLARSRLDMVIQSKSGTGKSLAFSICLLETYDEELKFPQALVVVPTREIAVQIKDTLEALGKYLPYFKVCEVIGGTDVKDDRKRIQAAKIIIGTPGRILHLINSAIFNTSLVKTIVLDEADKLLENGSMAKDVETILNIVKRNSSIQVIAATATVTTQFENRIKCFMKNPIGITPKQEVPVLLGIKQFAIELKEESDNIELMRVKVNELEKIFNRLAFKQCLLFTNSQLKTESYGNYLKKLGWKNEIINGSQEQAKRLRVLEKLKKFKCRVLISTDLMARGIDIENVNLVINLDLPYDCFTYLHRIGRAGRFGTLGLAITFLNGNKDTDKFKKMLGEIGSNKSMVLKFPEENATYDFWDFANKHQDELLEKIDEIASDQNGNVLSYMNRDIDEEEQDKNTLLDEIERRLLNENGHASMNEQLDTESLLDGYQKSCDAQMDEEPSIDAKEDEILSHNLMLLDIASKLIDKKEEHNDSNCFDASALLDDYEQSCHAKVSEDKVQVPEKEEFRQVIFSRKPNEIDEESILSDSESSESESSYLEYSDDGDDEADVTESYQQFSNVEQHFSVRQQYDQFVAGHYTAWQNTFYFQLANIENYVRANQSKM